MLEIAVNLASRSYRILVGPGALAAVGPELAKLRPGRKVAVFSDPAILALYGGAVIESLRRADFDPVEIVLEAQTAPPGFAESRPFQLRGALVFANLP